MCYPESTLSLLPSVPLFSFLLFCLEKKRGKKILLLAIYLKGNMNNKTSDVRSATLTWNFSYFNFQYIYFFNRKKCFPQTNFTIHFREHLNQIYHKTESICYWTRFRKYINIRNKTKFCVETDAYILQVNKLTWFTNFP